MLLTHRWYQLIVVISMLLTISGLVVACNGKVVEGFITEIDDQHQRLKIEDKWYQVSAETVILRNGDKSTLAACRPVSAGNYQWGSIILDSNGQINSLTVVYAVVEGLVEEVNFKESYLLLKVFKQSEHDKELGKYFFDNRFNNAERIKQINKGKHLILVTGQNKIFQLLID